MNAIELEGKYCAKNYLPLPVVLVRGEGVWLWDEDGNKYLDMMSAYSAVSHGHSNPRLVKVFQEQAGKLAIVSRAYYTNKLGPLAKKLCEISGLDMMLPMNTGAEAVETGIKASRLWGYKVKNIPENKAEIIVAEGNFHGRTTTIIGFSSEKEYQDGFGPFTAGFNLVPYGDVSAIEKAITPNTCAVMVEPIQGEGGIKLPSENYIRELRRVCDENNVLLMLDEIQSGFGRTGKMFCFEHDNILPDILLLGKALGGGMMPLSAVIGKKEVMELFVPGSHGSTFGGNPLACTVGLEALKILEEENLIENSAELGAYMMDELRKINSPAIKKVRGRGLWIGVVIKPDIITARKFCEMLKEEGVLSKETHETVVRFAPPLIITKEQIDWVLEKIRKVLAEI